MKSAVSDCNSFSHIKVSILSLLTLAQSDHNLTKLVCADRCVYAERSGGILWVLGGIEYDCSSVVYISKNNCFCYYFSMTFLQLGANYNESIWYV